MQPEYTHGQISIDGKVSMDTSAIMNVDRLEAFIFKYGSYLKESGKKIYINKQVYLELERHLSFSDSLSEKKEIAQIALELIEFNSEIFEIDKEEITEEDKEDVFADKHLLSDLQENKTKCPQLLITNDKKLCKDAFNINHQESCLGYPIRVCFLDPSGDLQKCNCVKEYHKSLKEKAAIKPKEKVAEVVNGQKTITGGEAAALGTTIFITGALFGYFVPKLIKRCS